MHQKTARILLVEDDEDDFVIAKDCLDELDEYCFSIDWVTGPEAALQQLKQNQHDICLLDFQLGAATGITVLEQANEVQSRVPIIMLTGQSDKILDKAALDAGAVDFIVKSELDSPRFPRAIRYALARQEVEKERLERIKIETQSRSKDRFLAHLSHELRTPLTSILGYTQLLLGSEKAQPVKPELNIILNNGKHLLSLLNDVLDLSKIAANKLELAPTKVDLNNFLVDLYSLMQVTAEDKGLSLRLHSTSALPETIETDPTRLRQILLNLINNGIKFTEQGSVDIAVSAQLRNNLCDLSFTVTDTGQGIPQNKIDNIFHPFEQVEDIFTRKEEGAGLGLAISSELAKKLGGSITVDSTVNQGSQFNLAISCEKFAPLTLPSLCFTKQDSLDRSTEYTPLSGTVLVVDDLADIRQLVGHFIRSFGLTVEFAENGQQALDKVSSNPAQQDYYDAVIMDIHMPEMNGKQAVTALREMGFKRPILALTAATMKGVEENLQTLGFNQVISKPVEESQLYHYLSAALSSTPATADQPALSQNPPSTETAEKRFLLVEDDHDAAEITKLILETLGVKVLVAHSGQECRKLLEAQSYWDKVLLDLHLPDEDGLSLAKFIAAQNIAADIQIISGEQVPSAELAKHGCSHALLKPINKEQLSQLVSA